MTPIAGGSAAGTSGFTVQTTGSNLTYQWYYGESGDTSSMCAAILVALATICLAVVRTAIPPTARLRLP